MSHALLAALAFARWLVCPLAGEVPGVRTAAQIEVVSVTRRCKCCRGLIDKTRDYKSGRVWVCRKCAENGTRHALRDTNTAERRDGRVVRKRIGDT